MVFGTNLCNKKSNAHRIENQYLLLPVGLDLVDSRDGAHKGATTAPTKPLGIVPLGTQVEIMSFLMVQVISLGLQQDGYIMGDSFVVLVSPFVVILSPNTPDIIAIN